MTGSGAKRRSAVSRPGSESRSAQRPFRKIERLTGRCASGFAEDGGRARQHIRHSASIRYSRCNRRVESGSQVRHATRVPLRNRHANDRTACCRRRAAYLAFCLPAESFRRRHHFDGEPDRRRRLRRRGARRNPHRCGGGLGGWRICFGQFAVRFRGGRSRPCGRRRRPVGFEVGSTLQFVTNSADSTHYDKCTIGNSRLVSSGVFGAFAYPAGQSSIRSDHSARAARFSRARSRSLRIAVTPRRA